MCSAASQPGPARRPHADRAVVRSISARTALRSWTGAKMAGEAWTGRADDRSWLIGRAHPRQVEAAHRRRSSATLLLGPLLLAAVPTAGPLYAQETTLSPAALKEIAQVEAEIDRIEAQALERLATPPDNQIQQIELLGK